MSTIPQMRYELVQFTAKSMIDFDTPTSEVENIWRDAITEVYLLPDSEVESTFNYELGSPNAN